MPQLLISLGDNICIKISGQLYNNLTWKYCLIGYFENQIFSIKGGNRNGGLGNVIKRARWTKKLDSESLVSCTKAGIEIIITCSLFWWTFLIMEKIEKIMSVFSKTIYCFQIILFKIEWKLSESLPFLSYPCL